MASVSARGARGSSGHWVETTNFLMFLRDGTSPSGICGLTSARLARDVLRDRDGALTDERDGHRMGAHAVARDAAGGVGRARNSEGRRQGVWSSIRPERRVLWQRKRSA